MKHFVFATLLVFSICFFFEGSVEAVDTKDYQKDIPATTRIKTVTKPTKKKETHKHKRKQTKKKERKKRCISMGRFKLTAYCPCYECSEGWGRKTHSGSYAESEHTVAADLSVLNLGDWITINGKKYKVEDSGGGVRGDHIDVFFDTHEEAEEFGVRYANVNLWRY